MILETIQNWGLEIATLILTHLDLPLPAHVRYTLQLSGELYLVVLVVPVSISMLIMLHSSEAGTHMC